MLEPPLQHAAPTLDPVCIEETGPWPFVTRRVFELADGTRRTWNSRHHRKNLLLREAAAAERIGSVLLRCLWMPEQLNWWIGTIFAMGALLFALASALSLSPDLAHTVSFDSIAINTMFFAGSIPFTTAAYLQLFQAANADTRKGSGLEATNLTSRRALSGATRRGALPSLFGWRPHDVGWLSCALQFIGTVLFNFNTFDSMIPTLNWFQQDLLVWVPNIIGSILFLASGYLAFIETCHSHWAWQPTSISWWVVFANLLGCVGFMVSAICAVSLPTATTEASTVATMFTLLGAIGFLAGSLIMLTESNDGKLYETPAPLEPPRYCV